jgi:hypothetical protein
MKAYRGSRDIDPFILNLNYRWRSVVRFTSRPFYPSPSLRSVIDPLYKRHCSYNVTLGRVREAIVAVKVIKCYISRMYVCSPRYAACKAHEPYFHLRPVRLYCIFPHYLINGTIFGKILQNTKCVFWLSLQSSSEIFHILRRTERDMIKNIYWSPCKVLRKLDFSLQIYEKYSNIKLNKNPSSESRDVPCGRKDRHGEANSCFSQFCEKRLKRLLPLPQFETWIIQFMVQSQYRLSYLGSTLSPLLLLLLLLLLCCLSCLRPVLSQTCLVSDLFSPVRLLKQRRFPTLRFPVSNCNTFRIMFDVPGTAVFCSESDDYFPGTAPNFPLNLLLPLRWFQAQPVQSHISCPTSVYLCTQTVIFNLFSVS